MSSLRRGLVATVAVVVAASALTACGASESPKNSDYAPASNVEYNPVNGISLDSTTVKVRNLYLLAAHGAVAPRLRMTLVNTTGTDDALVGATVGQPSVSGRLLGGGLAGAVPVNRGTTVLVGSDLGPQITFPGLGARAGTYEPVVLLFRTGRAVAGSMLVQNAVSEYSDGTVPQGTPEGVPTEAVLPSGDAEATAAP